MRACNKSIIKVIFYLYYCAKLYSKLDGLRRTYDQRSIFPICHGIRTFSYEII